MTNETARNLVGCSVLLAIGGALAMLPTERALPITGRIVPVVEMVRPEPLAEWQVETAVQACLEMAFSACHGLFPDDERRFEACMLDGDSRCTVGNTIGDW